MAAGALVAGRSPGRRRRGGVDEEVEAAFAGVLGERRVRRDEPLGPFTTFRVGGCADWFVDAGAEHEIAGVVGVARRLGLPVTVLGGGSNVLVADAGVRGLVVRVRRGPIDETAPGVVRASAGTTLNGLVRWMIHRELAGLEAWAGTPGTVGGAIHGNAHFRGRLISEVVTAVGLIGKDGAVVRTPRRAMDFGYDRSRLQRTGEVLVWAEFGVTRDKASDLRAEARASLRFRKRTQPLDAPSAGCVFQNPQPGRDRVPAGLPCAAGALVDRAGLKGLSIGGARVSTTHANFIVTEPGASAGDVRALIDRCRTAVAAKYDVRLIPEIVFLGEFEQPS